MAESKQQGGQDKQGPEGPAASPQASPSKQEGDVLDPVIPRGADQKDDAGRGEGKPHGTRHGGFDRA